MLQKNIFKKSEVRDVLKTDAFEDQISERRQNKQKQNFSRKKQDFFILNLIKTKMETNENLELISYAKRRFLCLVHFIDSKILQNMC